MSAPCRYALFSIYNQRAGFTQVKRLTCIQWKSSDSPMRGGYTAVLRAMANKRGNVTFFSSRCLSGSAADAKARVRRVSIEGNIGKSLQIVPVRRISCCMSLLISCITCFLITAVGKSTFAKLLQSACADWEVVAEPVSKWQNIESETSKVGIFTSSSFLLQKLKEGRMIQLTFVCSCL